MVAVVTCHPEHVGDSGVGAVDKSVENEVTDGWTSQRIIRVGKGNG